MVIQCEIKFDANPHGIYFAGQTLSGRVELSLDKPKKVRGICIRIVGFAACQWRETNSHSRRKPHGTRTTSKTYLGRQDYMATNIYVLGSGDGNPMCILPGIHTYGFSYSLPHHLPTSFEGTHGHIRYTVRVGLERPWKFDQTYKVGFTVLNQVDLNNCSPILIIPTEMETSRNFCCAGLSAGPLILSASIAQSGYVPGQLIQINANVGNNSRISISEIRFVLRKIIKYESQMPCPRVKEEIIEIVEARSDGVPAIANKPYSKTLAVPPVPPTNTNLCRIIQIRYDVFVEAKVSGFHRNVSLSMPVIIGTIPLPLLRTRRLTTFPYPVITTQPQMNYTAPGDLQMTPSASNLAHYPVHSNQPAILQIESNEQISIEDMPPPSYEECFGGQRALVGEDDEHPIVVQTFSPRYPVYSFIELAPESANASTAPPMPPQPLQKY